MRCENIVATGVPDVNACFAGLEIWIELKCPKLHVRASTPVFGGSHKISPVQFAWLKHQAIAGGHGAVLVCNEQLTLLLDGAFLDDSIHTQKLSEIKNRKGVIYLAEKKINKGIWLNLKETMRHYYGLN